MKKAFGPAGGLAQSGFQSIEGIVKGQGKHALKPMLPKMMKDVLKAIEIWTTGQLRTQSGNLMAKDLTFWQGLTAGVGFQPAAIAKKQRAISTNMADIDIQRTKETEFTTRLARAIFDREGRKADEIRREIREWNLANPDYRVIFASWTDKEKGTRAETVKGREDHPQDAKGNAATGGRKHERGALMFYVKRMAKA